MTDRELMHQALNALEWNLPVLEDYGDKEQLQRQHKAITALRDRLAKPHIKVEGPMHVVCQCDKCKTQNRWVGLTDEEIEPTAEQSDNYASFIAGVRFAQDKLKDKNT